MSIRRLQARTGSASRVEVAELAGHQLKFHKVGSRDGTAKCDAHETGCEEHVVVGVLFAIAEAEKPLLDQVEGLGFGYEKKDILVALGDGSLVEAYTYYATAINPALKPLHWYKEHVLRGARENRLPVEYIQMLEAVESVADHDPVRHARELSIYL